MIPFWRDQFDRHNQAPNANRPMILVPPHQNQLMQIPMQPPPLMFAGPPANFHQQIPSQQNHAFIHQQSQPQQPWMMPPPGPPASHLSMTTFVNSPPNQYHSLQPSQLPPQPSVSFQPTFSRGGPMPHTLFNASSSASGPSLLGKGPNTPVQSPFDNGNSGFKRKSHYIDESDREYPHDNGAPPLMNLPRGNFSNIGMAQNQHMFQSTNPRFIDQNPTRQRLIPPPLPPPLPPPPPPLQLAPPSAPLLAPPIPPVPLGHVFSNPRSSAPWLNNDRIIYPSSLSSVDEFQQQAVTSQLFHKHQSVPIDTLLREPGRSQRPSQILVVIRGLPGSGKSYVAELIRNEEEQQSKGTNKPKILSIDDYFLNENQTETKDPRSGKILKTTKMEYEYDRDMEETYRRSLVKLVRKSIDDRFFPFLIVDQNNEQIGHFRELVEYAETNKFRVYFIEVTADVELCVKRNVHKRTKEDIEDVQKRWEMLPLHYEILDIRSLLQSDAIDEVEMDETINESKLNDASTENDTEQGEECQITKKSKWDTMMDTDLDRLDGVCQRRTSSPKAIEKRLNNSGNSAMAENNATTTSDNLQMKKKRVRWADIEENAIHLHKKAVGFVIGQTEEDWQRMSDDYDPSQKLNQYKYI